MDTISERRDAIERVTNRERKRVKCVIREKQLCVEFHRTGFCKYGDNCKYTHGEQTSETKELVNGLMKDKCYAARRDQSYQLSLLKQKELTISQLCEYFQDSILSSSIKAPVLRHYSQLFVLRTIKSICLDQYVLFNPNSICIIGLAPSHSIIRNHHRCCSIQWGTTRQHKAIRGNMISGKSKKGGIWLDEDDVVCILEDENRESYPVVAGVRGRLLELNERIEENVSVISEKPATSGFICIIQPKFNDIDYLLNKLVSLDNYYKSLL